MFTRLTYDIRIWEQIRSAVERATDTLLLKISQEIARDRSLHEYQGVYPVPWQMREVMLQRAEDWIQRLYELCCEAHKRAGKELSEEFDRAVWAYWIEPFIMTEVQTTIEGYKASQLLELLLCSVGSPPEKRRQLKVGEKQSCQMVRNEIFFAWQQKMLRLTRRLDQSTSAAQFRAAQNSTAQATIQAPAEPPPSATSVPPRASHLALETAPPPLPITVAPPPVQLAETGSLESQNKDSGPEPSLPIPRYPGATVWQNIEIVFLSDFRVQVRINGKQTESANYAELGFDDGRSENPNKAWTTLKALAELRGVLTEGSKVGEPWVKVEKRIQEIRKRLRELFGIPADPLPFVEGAGYQAVFKIRCGPSFHT